MRPLTLFAALLLVLLPGTAQAQPRLIVGAGLSTPMGDFKDLADAGYHGRAGLQLGIPVFPLSIRAEGEYHKFGAVSGREKTSLLDGTLSAVLSLGGVGFTPYVLAGFGRFRLEEGLLSAAASETFGGYHGGLGVSIGALGFGGFAEIRYVVISREVGNLKYVPFTVGLRL